MKNFFTSLTSCIWLFLVTTVLNLLWRMPARDRETKPNYPAILLDPAYGTHKFAKLPDVTLHYVENGSPDKELLLFVHGFPEFWFSWRNQIVEFSRDYWTVAVDMRGFGDSEKKKGIKNYRMNVLTDDIKNFVHHLGRSKFTLVAHDWGGAVGHHFIRSYPNMLNRYILLNTVFSAKLNETMFKNKEQFCKSWYIFMMMLPFIPEWLLKANDFKAFENIFGRFSTAEEINAYKYMFRKYSQRNGAVNYYRANFHLRRKFADVPSVEALNTCKIAGLYIHGSDDFAITEKVAVAESFEGIRNVTCVNIPNADHFVQMQSPERVNRIIRDFLSNHWSYKANNLISFQKQEAVMNDGNDGDLTYVPASENGHVRPRTIICNAVVK